MKDLAPLLCFFATLAVLPPAAGWIFKRVGHRRNERNPAQPTRRTDNRPSNNPNL